MSHRGRHWVGERWPSVIGWTGRHNGEPRVVDRQLGIVGQSRKSRDGR